MASVRLFILALLMLINLAFGRNEFSLLTFSQEWPPSFCAMKDWCNYPPDVITGWNIHGLWPSTSDGEQYKCHSHKRFDFNALHPIMEELRQQWANLKAYKKPELFWRYEWRKHGQCSLEDAVTGSELKYFKTALVLKQQLDLKSRLASVGIVPDDDHYYEKSDIYEALRSIYHVRAKITCVYARHRFYWYETKLCMDLNLNLVDCPERSVPYPWVREECPDRMIFPSYKSMWRKMLFQLVKNQYVDSLSSEQEDHDFGMNVL